MMTFKDNYPATPGPLNHSEPLFKYLHILQFKDIYKLQVLRFVYKWKYKLIPLHFCTIFMKNYDLYSLNTNSSTNVIMEKGFKDFTVLPRDTLHFQSSNLANYGYKSMRVNGPKLWNELSDEIRNLSSLRLFKRRVKSHLLGEYSSSGKVKNHFYLSELSANVYQFTVSKMQLFFVPHYLPSTLRVKLVSHSNGHIKINLRIGARL